MLDDIDLQELRKIRRIGYFFRYPLHRNNFYPLEIDKKLRGHYTAKPLYGKLTAEGRVDKTSGFNGDIAALFVPLAAQNPQDARLYIAHTESAAIVDARGQKNWPVINNIAAQYIKEQISISISL